MRPGAHVPQLLSLRPGAHMPPTTEPAFWSPYAPTTEPALWSPYAPTTEPMLHKKGSHLNDKWAPQVESSPCLPQLEKARGQ